MCVRLTVELDGVRRHFHANKLGKFHVRVDSVTCDSFIGDLESMSVNTCAVIYAVSYTHLTLPTIYSV